MKLTEREVTLAIPNYEGLVKKTARMLVGGTHPTMLGRPPIEIDIDDVEQILWIKVLKGLRAFDPDKARASRRRGRSACDLYINMVVQDQAKDIATKRRRGEAYIEDYTNAPGGANERRDDSFEGRYLSEDHDEVYGEAEDEPPLIPNTLTERERHVLVLLYRQHKQTEIAVQLGLTKREVESVVRQIRTKLQDWRPASSESSLALAST